MTKNFTDRRIKDRFQTSCLTVQLREQGFFKRGKPSIAVSCLDFNRYGMAVLCPRPLARGARLLLEIEGKYIYEPHVKARVVTCSPYQTGFRVSLQFTYCLNANNYSRAVDNALSRIEGFYNRLAS
ncbi:PilZ domain-containing protein [Marinobacter sp.]|uniref:PilZ domain-containing protein n=1 Tax=Marinobacter sp. TaxID=50741 RepID=UPI002B26935C|nr:PilZ domain-containing protein [Marinobacter sp.]